MDRTIEVTLWDRLPEGEDVFLGECSVDLQNAFETDRAVWLVISNIFHPFCSNERNSQAYFLFTHKEKFSFSIFLISF